MLDLSIIVIALVCGAAFLLMPTSHGSAQTPRIICVSNLKQVGTAMRLYANDWDGKYPSLQVTNEAWSYYQMIGEQLSAPRMLICPADIVRTSGKRPTDFGTNNLPTSFQSPGNRNNSLSYFYGVDATGKQPDMILSGDRNVTTNTAMLAGLLSLNTNASWTFTSDIHDKCGNIGLADGSVQQVTPSKLRQIIGSYTNATQRIILL